MASSKTPRTKPLKPAEVPDLMADLEKSLKAAKAANAADPEPEATDVPVPDPDVPGDDAPAEAPAPAAPEAEDELTKAFNEPPEWIADHQLPEDKATDISAGPDDVEPIDELDVDIIFIGDQAHPEAIFFRQDTETLEVSLQPIPEWREGESGEEYSDRIRLRNQFLARLRVAIDREQFHLDDVLKSTAREIAAQAARGRQV